MIWQMLQFNVWLKNRGPTFWHYARHSTISQSRAIYFQRPKSANLALAGANAYETVGNRWVKDKNAFDSEKFDR